MKRLTEKQAIRAGGWLAAALEMEDWDVRLAIQDDPPSWIPDNARMSATSVGCCNIAYQRKRAAIWVCPSPEKGLFNDGDALVTLFHEYLHIFAADVEWEDVLEPRTRSSEQAIDRLAVILAAAYRARVKV